MLNEERQKEWKVESGEWVRGKEKSRTCWFRDWISSSVSSRGRFLGRACSGGGLSCCGVLEGLFHGWDYTGHIEFWGGRKNGSNKLSNKYQAIVEKSTKENVYTN
ncbi:MAG: hypothetical protein IPN58_12650 [Anaerolineales bacterium]|nr:hypothetical protein [Anaerolineales bacterium]